MNKNKQTWKEKLIIWAFGDIKPIQSLSNLIYIFLFLFIFTIAYQGINNHLIKSYFEVAVFAFIMVVSIYYADIKASQINGLLGIANLLAFAIIILNGLINLNLSFFPVKFIYAVGIAGHIILIAPDIRKSIIYLSRRLKHE